jgi:hypothetical protein
VTRLSVDDGDHRARVEPGGVAEVEGAGLRLGLVSLEWRLWCEGVGSRSSIYFVEIHRLASE